jgi:hypothetical protein
MIDKVKARYLQMRRDPRQNRHVTPTGHVPQSAHLRVIAADIECAAPAQVFKVISCHVSSVRMGRVT